MSRQKNPFKLEAVSTFGSSLVTCESLGYMGRARDELDEYLSTYAVASRRYGGAFGVRGAHGSGKTHLLSWLAERARTLRHIKPNVIYAKADSPRLFDLLRQICGQIERTFLISLLDEAALNTARVEARVARATESLEERLVTPQDAQIIYGEGNLDREHIENLFAEQLRAIQVPSRLVTALLSVPDSRYGDIAYRWLDR
jgi:hypothetical protein